MTRATTIAAVAFTVALSKNMPRHVSKMVPANIRKHKPHASFCSIKRALASASSVGFLGTSSM
eukprot:CAMPEP_0117620264 /NCGR_PEP_ID=MMETSP0784-20121206/87040_1 /TAXON_ID=39447 /ORGANISM="" /LENGTH=62 /DNA_ID=CAMNT_0005424175 /DNA_START=649 /DNA_END=837 /DNA_ORIENTATION=-